MFGLEKDDKKVKKFDFDLEIEIIEDPHKAKKLLQLSEQRLATLKTCLKNGKDPAKFDNYGILLHGYAALSRVLKKVVKKTNKR